MFVPQEPGACVNAVDKETQMNDINSLKQDAIPWKGLRFPMQCNPIR